MEKAFSFFLYLDPLERIAEVGYVCSDAEGDTDEILLQLKKSVNEDHQRAKRYRPRTAMTYDDYMAMCRLGTHLRMFEQIFCEENARPDPLCLVTIISNGQPKIDLVTSHKPFSFSDHANEFPDFGRMPDYLRMYMTESGFNAPQLINDDYFEAIKILFNNRKYVSASKLVLSCIDTLSFIEFGDNPNIFQKWLTTYADLSRHTATADDLWELRNGLLHMSNLESRKVREGKASRIIVYVGQKSEIERSTETKCTKYLNLRYFIDTLADAIANWLKFL